jgi:hypothetical protein
MPKKAKRASSSAMKDFAVRGLLIVFSVLLALFLNGIWEQQKVTANLTAAYRSIRIEIESNRNALIAATEYHSKCIAALDSLLQKSSREIARTALAELLSQTLPDGLNPPNLQSAAWNTLHSTGLVAHLKFDDAYPFTKLFDLQKEGVGNASVELAEYYSQPELFEKQGIATSLKALKSLLNELYEQEKRLLSETNTVLNAGQNWRYLE